MPEPIERKIHNKYIKYIDLYPNINNTTKIKVEIAVIISPKIINIFLLYLSPQTPEKIDIIICGVYVQTMEIATAIDENDINVIYQIIVKDTIVEPNIEHP